MVVLVGSCRARFASRSIFAGLSRRTPSSPSPFSRTVSLQKQIPLLLLSPFFTSLIQGPSPGSCMKSRLVFSGVWSTHIIGADSREVAKRKQARMIAKETHETDRIFLTLDEESPEATKRSILFFSTTCSHTWLDVVDMFIFIQVRLCAEAVGLMWARDIKCDSRLSCRHRHHYRMITAYLLGMWHGFRTTVEL